MSVPRPVVEVPASLVPPERLRAFCERRREPVVFRRLVADWLGLGWDLRRLSERWPERTVRATATTADGTVVRSIELSKDRVVRGMDVETTGVAPEGAANWYFDVPTDVPELAPEFDPARVVQGRVDFFWLFLGRDTATCTHYHSRENGVLCQVHGTKHVVLHPPGDTRFLYPHPVTDARSYMVSRVDVRAPDVRRFPKVRRAHPLSTTLSPGDVLFIPVHFWHAAYGIDRTLSVGLFWNARFREYRFPEPALRTLVAMSLARGRSFLRA